MDGRNGILSSVREAHVSASAAGGVLFLAAVAMLAVALAVTPSPARASIGDGTATPTWTAKVSGDGVSSESAYDVAIGSDGAVYVCGVQGDPGAGTELTLAKFVGGALAWPIATYTPSGTVGARGDGLALGPDGVVYTTGMENSGTPDLVLVKWSAKTGKRLWVRRYRAPAGTSARGWRAGVDRRGNVTVMGSIDKTIGADGWIVRSWTPSGVLRWTWRSDFAHDSVPTGFIVAHDGSVYVSGSVGAMIDFAATTVRLSTSGKRLWTRSYKGPEGLSAQANGLTARPGGGVYVAGSAVTSARKSDGMVLSYTAAGALAVFALDSAAGGATLETFEALSVTSDGSVVAAGSTSGIDSLIDPRYVLYGSNGIAKSSNTYPSAAGNDDFGMVATDAFGGFYLAGTTTPTADDRRLLVVRRSTVTGGGWWTCVHGTGGADSHYWPGAIAVRGTTAVIAGSLDTGTATGRDQLVLGFVY